MRKLAVVKKIDAIEPIENADAIEVAVIGGWKVVVKKGEFSVGDLAIYVEIDSWVPHHIAPFLSKGKEPREYNSVRGERLRTVRLRGQISQGLLLPLSVLPHSLGYQYSAPEGDDVTEWLGIQKWEAPIPACLAGSVLGAFPSWIPKTDQERVQNLVTEVAEWVKQGLEFEVTEKLDGSSMTVYVYNEDEGVCSRNLRLKESDANSLWRVARREQLIEKIRTSGRNLALQGEIIGEGIQGNPYKIKGQDFYLFDIYDIDRGEYFAPQDRRKFAQAHGIRHVPWLTGCGDKDLGVGNVQEILTWAEGKSVLNDKATREGIVFKCNTDPSIHFKAISNLFLLRTGS
jgi:RNA ligase (TIGR02306 family)